MYCVGGTHMSAPRSNKRGEGAREESPLTTGWEGGDAWLHGQAAAALERGAG